jgi:hypothetical protein
MVRSGFGRRGRNCWGGVTVKLVGGRKIGRHTLGAKAEAAFEVAEGRKLGGKPMGAGVWGRGTVLARRVEMLLRGGGQKTGGKANGAGGLGRGHSFGAKAEAVFGKSPDRIRITFGPEGPHASETHHWSRTWSLHCKTLLVSFGLGGQLGLGWASQIRGVLRVRTHTRLKETTSPSG